MLLLVVLLMAVLPSVENGFLRMVGYRWQGELQFGGYTSLLYYLVNGVTYIFGVCLAAAFVSGDQAAAITEGPAV